MMTSDNSNYMLIGLPHSGKTTFIAALWHVVESGELDESLIINNLPEDSEYLNSIRDTWLSCEDFERTKVEQKHKIKLKVLNNLLNKESELLFPDVSGEMYKSHFEFRKLDLEYYEMLQTANGIILFINPDHLIEPILISEINSCLASKVEQSKEEQDKIKKSIDWEHKHTPTQVVLVDLLQMIALNINNPFKVAVVISAWDLIKKINNNITPTKWLETSLQLLVQYLNANNSTFTYKCYGISAQGNSYTSDNSELLNLISPSERIKVQTEQIISNDITLPIKWLLNNE